MNKLMLSPFREMMSLREAMNRLFDETFFRPGITINGGYGLDVDVEAKGDEFIVRADVPGLKPEDLHIDVVDNTVTLRGEFRSESKTEDKNYLTMEGCYGPFSRTIALPTSVNPSKAEAVVENGVLTLRLSKTDEAKPKAIPVKSK